MSFMIGDCDLMHNISPLGLQPGSSLGAPKASTIRGVDWELC